MVYDAAYWDTQRFNLLKTLVLSRFDVLTRDESKQFTSFYLKYLTKVRKTTETKLAENDNYIRNSLPFKVKLPTVKSIYEQTQKMTLKFNIRLDDIENFCSAYKIFINFLQKQNFNKIQKIKKFQIDLPIASYKDQILYLLKTHPVMIIAGDTGCGKSTQVPQFLLHGGYTNIACTQPRRIACISLAKRVSYETLNEFGHDVAYHVRFDTNRIENTKILFLTEGLLLRQFQADPQLSQYNVIIVDEVHERHLNSDFLLGILKCLVKQRNDLKIILMSATINANLFSSYFDGAPLIQVPGRLHPIILEYIPDFSKKDIIIKEKTNKFDTVPYVRLLQMIDQKYPVTEGGDLLIFLNGVKEINMVVDSAIKYSETNKHWIVLPLHSNLSLEQQDKVFDYAPDGYRKCVVSTNIAETSLTIDGIRFVCDSGKVNEMAYDPSIKLKKLVEMWISKSSAEQRKGRAGRTGPGICFRMYSEADFNDFDDYPIPEIKRADLNSLILCMFSLGLNDPLGFPFIEQPELSSMNCGMRDLIVRKAVTNDNQITILGRALASLPLEPSAGLVLLYGCLLDTTIPSLLYVSSLSIQSPFTSSFSGRADFREKNLGEITENFVNDSEGDPFILIKTFSKWLTIKRSDKFHLSRVWCKKLGIIERRFYDMVQLCSQFKRILVGMNFIRKKEHKKHNLTKTEVAELKNKKEEILLAPKKRKFLKPDMNIIGEEDGDFGELDVKEIDFRLGRSGAVISDIPSQLSLETHILFSLAISLGLYPQFAIPDDNNEFRKDSEQFFHTKDKQFLSLHPNSFFGMYPELLRDKLKAGKQPWILIYAGLLETTKPYLLNTTKVPAIPALMLTSNIDTDPFCQRIVVDGWIEFKFNLSQDALTLLCLTISVRNLLTELTDHYFSVSETDNDEDLYSLLDDLTLKLTDYCNRDIDCTLKYIVNADRQLLYRSSNSSVSDLPAELLYAIGDVDVADKKHPTKGGFCVTSYLTFGCLTDMKKDIIDQPYLQSHFTCPNCKLHLICTAAEQIAHSNSCKAKVNKTEKSDSIVEEVQKPKVEKIYYTCNMCQQELFLSRTEILIHIKSHDTL